LHRCNVYLSDFSFSIPLSEENKLPIKILVKLFE